jgi:hypothetical protein
MKSWREMDNAELRRTIKGVCNSCTSADKVNRIMKERHGYPYSIAVSYSEPLGGRRMNMFMAHGHDGKTLS